MGASYSEFLQTKQFLWWRHNKEGSLGQTCPGLLGKVDYSTIEPSGSIVQ